MQLKGSGAELSRRVQNLRAVSGVQANSIGAVGSAYLPGSTKIDDQSLADMQEVSRLACKLLLSIDCSNVKIHGYGKFAQSSCFQDHFFSHKHTHIFILFLHKQE